MDRYSFDVELFHPLLHAGLSRRTPSPLEAIGVPRKLRLPPVGALAGDKLKIEVLERLPITKDMPALRGARRCPSPGERLSDPVDHTSSRQLLLISAAPSAGRWLLADHASALAAAAQRSHD